MTGKKISEFITYPKTFEKYRWYKPILVFIVGVVIFFILSEILNQVFIAVYGENLINSISNGGYEALNTELGEILTDLAVIMMIPSLYLATKIVRDRPFSSYSSSRGGWNFKLYFKALVIPLILFLIYECIETAITGQKGTYHFSIPYLIICLIFVPLQCIAEEYVFRGLIMQTFGSWFNIPILAIILQSVVFSMIHGYNILGNIGVFVSGLVMGFLAWKANGIEVSSAMHTANNLSITIIVMFGLQSTTSYLELTDLISSIVIDVIIGIIIYYIAKKTDWYGEIPENTQN